MQKLSIIKNSDFDSYLSSGTLDSSNWVLSGRKSFTSQAPSGALDISNCDRFMVKISVTAISTAHIYGQFDTDTGANYHSQILYGQGTAVGAARSLSQTAFMLAGYNYSIQTTTIEFDKRTKYGVMTVAANGLSNYFIQPMAIWYGGSAPMNLFNIVATSSVATGVIEVYKWQDVKVANLADYELVKEYNLNNQVLNDTISVDTSYSDQYLVQGKLYSSASGSLSVRLNGDSGSNYRWQQIGLSSLTNVNNLNNTHNALFPVPYGVGAAGCSFESKLFLKSGSERQYFGTCSGIDAGSSNTYLAISSGSWKNTTDAVTSMTLSSYNAVTGVVKVYRLMTKQLLKQNIKPIELVLSKSYSGQAVSETLDFTDCDSIELELNSSTNFSNFLRCYFNGDTADSSYNRCDSYGGSTSGGALANLAPYLGFPGYASQLVRITVCRASKYALAVEAMRQPGGQRWVQNQSYEWTGSASLDSLVLTCSGGFTGKIKVWKKY